MVLLLSFLFSFTLLLALSAFYHTPIFVFSLLLFTLIKAFYVSIFLQLDLFSPLSYCALSQVLYFSCSFINSGFPVSVHSFSSKPLINSINTFQLIISSSITKALSLWPNQLKFCCFSHWRYLPSILPFSSKADHFLSSWSYSKVLVSSPHISV